MRVKDEQGETIAESRSFTEVMKSLPDSQKSSVVQVSDNEWQQEGLTDWQWDELPKSINIRRGVAEVPVFPTIMDEGDTVALRLLDNRERSNLESRNGLVRLFQIANRKNVKSQVNWLPELDKLSVIASPIFQNSENFKAQLGDLIVRIAFIAGEKIPRQREAYEKLLAASNERISVATQEVAKWLPRMLEQYQAVRVVLEKQTAKNSHAVGDVRGQLKSLFSERFLQSAAWHRLKSYPRYLEAIQVRLDKLQSGSFDKDVEFTHEVAEFAGRYRELAEQHSLVGKFSDELDQIKWMLEEYRVSLFAQQLGTSEKVSPQRIEKQFAKAMNS